MDVINGNKTIIQIVSNGEIQIDSSVLRMTPKSRIHLNYEWGSSVNQVVGIENPRILLLRLKGLGRLETLLKRILASIESDEPKEILKFHWKNLQKAVDHFQRFSSQDSPSDIFTVRKAFERVRSVIFDSINALESIHLDNIKVKDLADSFVRRLQLIHDVPFNYKMSAHRKSSFNIDEGYLSFFYVGKFCLYQLCMENVAVQFMSQSNVCNGKCDHYTENRARSHDSARIEVSPTKGSGSRKLSSRIEFKENDKLEILISTHGDLINGNLSATVSFHKSLKRDVVFKITENDISYQTDQLKIGQGLEGCKLNAKTFLQSASWSSIISKLDGVCYKGKSSFLRHAVKYFEEIISTTRNKIKLLDQKITNTDVKFKIAAKSFESLKSKLKQSRRNHQKAHSQYKNTELYLKLNQTAMDSYFNLHPELVNLIERNLNKVCQLKSCQKKCLEMPFCEICQNEIIIPTTVMDCKQNIEKIRVNRLKQSTQTCHLRRYLFTTVYTGSCGNPRHHGKTEGGDPTDTLVTIGAGVASLFNPVLGLAIGFVGKILSGLFSSCDDTYDVITSPYTITEPCVKLISVVETIERQYSVCLRKQIKVKTGYDLPEPCRCRMQTCPFKVSSPKCVFDNLECNRKRELYLKGSQRIPKVYTELWSSIRSLQNRIEESRLIMEDAKLKYDRDQKKFEEISNLLEKHEIRLKNARSIKENFQHLFRKEICYMNLQNQHKDLSNIIEILDIKFDTNLPILNNVKLQIVTKSLITGQVSTTSVVHSVNNNDDVSLQESVVDFLEKTLCTDPSKRNRRSTDNIVNITNDRPIENKRSQSSCLGLQKSVVFMNEVMKGFKHGLKRAIQRKHILDHKTTAKYLGPTKISPTPFQIATAQQNLIKTINDNVESFEKELRFENIRENVKDRMELFVSLQNGSCFTFLDCLDESFLTLEKLPTRTKRYNQDYKLHLDNIKGLVSSLHKNDTGMKNKPLELILKTVFDIEEFFEFVSNSVYHCADAPVVKMRYPPEIHIRKDNVYILFCKVKSVAPVDIYWYKDNKVIDGEASALLKIIGSLESLGSYKCLGVSSQGVGESNATFVNVYEKPRIFTEPKDVNYILPSNGAPLMFLCNATGYPEPDYQWFYHKDLKDPGIKVADSKDNNLTLDTYQTDANTGNGYYSCVARNKYGQRKSRMARLNIFRARLPNQDLVIEAQSLAPMNDPTIFKDMEKKAVTKAGQTVRFNIYNDTTIQIKLSYRSSLIDKLVFPDRKEMLKFEAKTRADLANAAANIVRMLFLEGESVGNSLSRTSLLFDKSTIRVVEQNVSICSDASTIHPNGYMCGMTFFYV